MKTGTKIVLALPLALATCFGIDCYLYERRVAAKEKRTYDDQLGFYKRFLKPGMTRVEVERELKLRSIPVSQRLQTPAVLDLVLFERFGSPKSYCSFEDAGLRLEFEPVDNATTYEGNHFNDKPDDRLSWNECVSPADGLSVGFAFLFNLKEKYLWATIAA